VTDPHYYNLGRQIAANAKRQSEEALPYSMHVNRLKEASKTGDYDTARKIVLGDGERVETERDDTYPDGRQKGFTYVTKDSGERTTFETGMQRDVTTGKPRFDLIDPEPLPYEKTMTYRHAMLMARGAEKYGERNWEKASTEEEYRRFKQSAYRHFLAWFHDEVDEDHGAAVLFNIRGAEYVRLMLS
jgi:hypothetical protein